MDMFVSSTAFAAAPAAMPASPDASVALVAAAASLLDHLARGRADRHAGAARRHGARLRRLRCRGRLGLEDGLRRLRGGDGPVPAQVRPGHARPRGVARGAARHAGQGRGAAAVAHAPLRREPGASAILDADRARLRRRHRGRDHAGRSRAGTLGRHRPARHLRRARRRPPRLERAGRDPRRPCSAGSFPAFRSRGTTPPTSTTISTAPCGRASC